MTEPRSHEDPQALLAHAGWVRALARRLMADGPNADDLVQETWLAALRRSGEVRAPRAWLARVLNHRARRTHRDERARSEREARHGAPTPPPGAEAAVQAVWTHRRLVDAVLALAEPYRTTLVLRFFEECSAAEIARRHRVPASTVRNRLKRGLAILRERLEEEFDGDTRALGLALGALVQGTGAAAGPALTSTGVLTLAAKPILLGGAAAAALATLAVLFHSRDTRPDRGQVADVNRPAAGDVAPADVGPIVPKGAERTSLGPAAAAAPSGADASGVEHRGRVVSAAGMTPLPDATIELWNAPGATAELPPAIRTDTGGSFTLPRPPRADQGLRVRHPDHYAAKLQPQDVVRDGTGFEIVLAPAGVLEVLVVDGEGLPLAGQQVWCKPQLDSGRLVAGPSHPGGTSGRDGRVTLRDLPCGAPLHVGAGEPGIGAQRTVILDMETRRGQVTVEPWRWSTLRGQIVWVGGQPAGGLAIEWRGPAVLGTAWGMGGPATTSGPDGRFELERVQPGVGELIFGTRGVGSHRLHVPRGQDLDLEPIELPQLQPFAGTLLFEPPWDPNVRLRLFRGGRQLAELLPRPDGTFETQVSPGPIRFLVTRGGFWEEDLMRPSGVLASVATAAPNTDFVLRIETSRGGVVRGTLPDSPAGPWQLRVYGPRDETTGSMRRHRWSHDFELDEDGSFQIEGVSAGTQDLLFHGPGGLGAWVPGVRVEADAPAELGHLNAGLSTLRGQVLDGLGHPVPGANLTLWREWSPHRENEQVLVSAEDGSFEATDLDPGPYSVFAEKPGAGISPRRQGLLLPAGTETLTLVQESRGSITGRVLGPDGPAPYLTMSMQRIERNQYWDAATDVTGRFDFGDVEPGPYRVSIRSQLSLRVDVDAGEAVELELDLAADVREHRLVRDGQPVEGLEGVSILGIDPASPDHGVRHRGEVLSGGRFLVRPLAGRALAVISLARTENGQVLVTAYDPASPQIDYLPGSLTLDTGDLGFHGPAPQLHLEELDGEPLRDVYSSSLRLVPETRADGGVHYPSIPAGAGLRLEGLASDGSPHSLRVTASGRPGQAVAWP